MIRAHIRMPFILFLACATICAGPQTASIHAGTTPFVFIGEGVLGADFDGDGRVNFADFLLFVGNFNLKLGDPDFDGRYDLDGDGAVKFSDFLTFSAQFGQQSARPAPSPYEVYVVDIAESSVIAFDYNSHLVLDYMPFREPAGVAVSRDQQSIYVSEAFGFFALDTDHTVLFSVPTGSAGRIATSPDGKTAYVTERSDGRLQVIDLELQASIDTLELVAQPSDIAISPDGQTLYVASQAARTVLIVGVDPLRIAGAVQTGATPGEILASPDGKRVYVSHLDEGSIAIIDGASPRLLGTVQLGSQGALGLAISPDGRTLYATASASIVALDTERNLVTDTRLLGDATSTLGVSPDGKRAYVGTLVIDQGGPGLTVVDLETFEILGRMRGFNFPTDIDFRRIGNSVSQP